MMIMLNRTDSPVAEFVPLTVAGTPTPMYQHRCVLYGCRYVSAAPSPDPLPDSAMQDRYVVPGCGCRPSP